MNNQSTHLLAQHGELLQVGSVTTASAQGVKSGLVLKAMGAAIMCIVVAAGAGHFTQSIREEAARDAAAEKAAAAHQTEEARIAAAQVAGLKKRLTAMQTQISTQRDNLLTDLQGIIVAGEKHSDVAEMLRRYPAPYKPLQAIDPAMFESFLVTDRQSGVATGTSPQLEQHYQSELAKLKRANEYLKNFEQAVNLIDRGQPLPAWMGYERFAIGPKAEPREVEAPVAPAPEPPRSTPSVPIAPEPVMPLDTPAAQKRVPAAKPRTAVTGEPGKVQVLDW
jgi:hypothetical protein